MMKTYHMTIAECKDWLDSLPDYLELSEVRFSVDTTSDNVAVTLNVDDFDFWMLPYADRTEED